METSAKSGLGVNKAFECLSDVILDKIENGEIDAQVETGIKVGTGDDKKVGKLSAGENRKKSEKKKCNC